jgi:hypothetical protein
VTIKIAANCELPDDAVTQTFGFIGHKGSGKSYSAMVLAEEFLASERQIVALDPVGVWYSLRLAAGGAKPSRFKLPILGGLRGDVPLEHKAGRTVADFIVDTGSSAVLDVSLFRKGQRKEFVADFAEQLFYRQKSVRRPLHLFVEEAQVFAPQMAKGEERMLGAIEDIVRIGRNFGLGSSLITQRPQSVNKEVLNQVEPLVLFRLIAKHERDAIKGWLQHVGADADRMLAEIHSLKQGDCYFWSPAWLDIFVKTRFKKRTTFDASSTPTGDEVTPAELRPVDLDKLQAAIADSLAEAKANDPKELKRRVKELEQRLAAAVQPTGPTEEDIAKAISARDAEWLASIQPLRKRLFQAREDLNGLARGIAEDIGEICDIERMEHVKAVPLVIAPSLRKPPAKGPMKMPQVIPSPRPALAATVDGEPLPDGQVRLLKSFFWLADEERTPMKVAFYANLNQGGHFKNLLGSLRSSGLVSGWSLTDAGRAKLRELVPEIEPKPTGSQLREWLRPKLADGHNRMLDALIAANGERMSNEELATASGLNMGGHFKNLLGKLRSLQIAEGHASDGGVRVAAVFLD